MPLTRQEKVAAVDEMTGKLTEATTFYLTDYKGLTVEQANDLRRRFRESGVEFKVVKNTLLRLAMERVGGYEDLYDHLSGPTAVAFTEEPAAPARVIKKFVSDTKAERPELKVAFVDGSVYQANQLDVLAALKSRDELLGDIAGLLMAPMTNVIGALQAQGSNLVGVLKTLAERES